MSKKILAIVLSIAICLNVVFMPQKASAWSDYLHSGLTTLGHAFTGTGTWATLGRETVEYINKHLGAILATSARIGALLAIQKASDAFMQSDDPIIRDYNNYLYIAPQQRAMEQMNSFFNTVSRGRLSRLNYEGIGPNYDAYLVAQARQTIGGQNFVTNIQDQVTDPTQMFSAGNMKGIMAYMQCANNVACYTLVSSSQYQKEFSKAQEIAKSEQQNGYLPIKKNGRITSPAALISTTFTQVDQLGTEMIMKADNTDEGITQIFAGAAITLGSRIAAYETADSVGKAAIKNKNDQFPFSLSYSSNGGVGINAGGVTINTGMASLNLQQQVGNLCAKAGFTLSGNGDVSVDIKGQKYNCRTNAQSSVKGPSATGTAPGANVGSSTIGGGSTTIGQ